MRIHRKNKSPDDIINISFLDQDHNVILEFEDKAHSSGSKILVYDNLGYPVYLIDDTTNGDYTELTILQGSKAAAKLQISDNFFAGYNVSIDSADGIYGFHFLRRALEKNGVPVAEIRPHPVKVEALIDDNTSGNSNNTERANLGIIRLLRKGKVNILNYIDFDIHADDPASLNLYLTMLYVIQFLVMSKITSLII